MRNYVMIACNIYCRLSLVHSSRMATKRAAGNCAARANNKKKYGSPLSEMFWVLSCGLGSSRIRGKLKRHLVAQTLHKVNSFFSQFGMSHYSDYLFEVFRKQWLLASTKRIVVEEILADILRKVYSH